MIHILTSHHTHPSVRSLRTVFFENVLAALKNKTDVKITWLVYRPEKLDLKHETPDEILLDIHNFKNAIEVIKYVKPNIIHVAPNLSFIDYALALGGHALGIPVTIELINDLSSFLDHKTIVTSFVKQFFQNSLPTDNLENNKQFMRRGRFFIYKYLFLLKTQKAIGMNSMNILKSLLMLIKSYVSIMQHLSDPRIPYDLGFVEGEKLIEPLVKVGFDRSKLVLTGSPYYDKAFQSLKNQCQHTENKKIRVLLLTNAMYEHGVWSKDERDSLVKGIAQKIYEHKNEMELAIKIHPSTESISEYRSLQSVDMSVSVYQTGEVLEFIENSDVVLVYSTGTSTIFSLIARKPIIVCNIYDTLENDHFLEHDLALECRNLTNLVFLIKKILLSNPATDEKINSYVSQYFFKSDGLSSQRISDAMINLVKTMYQHK